MVGASLLVLGYVLMAMMHSLWQFYLIYGLIIAIGIGGFWAPLLSTVARWFTGKRGLMTGIVSGGIGFGSLVLAPLLTHVISLHGWRLAFLIVGVSVLVGVTLSAIFIRRAPSKVEELFSQENSDKNGRSDIAGLPFGKVIRTRAFWLLCFIYSCLGFSQGTVLVHIVPHAADLGISAIQSAGILSIIGGVSLASRILIGAIADVSRVKTSFIISLGLMLLSLLWLQVAGDLWKLYLFAFIFGLAYGGSSCLQSLISAELFGLSSLGVIISTFSFAFGIGGGIGPFLAGHIYDVNRSYWLAFLICIVLMAAGLIFACSLRSPGKRAIPTNERTAEWRYRK
jgi:MFS family permease